MKPVKMQHPELPGDRPILVAAGNIDHMTANGWKPVENQPESTPTEEDKDHG